jgi:signal peptidase I
MSLALTVLVVALAVFLWPARLGGATRLVVVSGTSMEPVYDLGDIVLARDGRRADVGDIVVFAVPEGSAQGMLVIHRIIDIDAAGRFVTQGDNRSTPDHWRLSHDDIVGTPLFHIPRGGQAIVFLGQGWVLAVVIGLVVMLLLWPRSDDEESVEGDDERERAGPDPEPDTTADDPTGALLLDPFVAVDPLAAFDDARPIDPAVMAEAEEWLERELAGIRAATARVDQSSATTPFTLPRRRSPVPT